MDDWDAPATPKQVETMQRAIVARVSAERARARRRAAALVPAGAAVVVAAVGLSVWAATGSLRSLTVPTKPALIALDCYAEPAPDRIAASVNIAADGDGSLAQRAWTACADVVPDAARRTARASSADPILCAVEPDRIAVVPEASGRAPDELCSDLGLEPFRNPDSL